ncbi:CoA transferase [Psychromarinibacter sp. C21-152]|uniref:CoA transferase n=1 Tax=Psychromarinibacter sediminicola TaxID=3033385 RepID=A0AAE3NYQ1_9RHOB|nr:CoA transferase [Psychromarinibacter sediminicola]MDF0603345.1 CoA transferase [Psychromarinibacter sediminicola]
MTSNGPLSGIRVLDLTIAMAGPLCSQRLGEMGAEVVKIEAPGGGDFSRHSPMAGVSRFGDATCFVTLNRNKRSLVLDLKSEAGKDVLYRLVESADVFVQNFRPRVAAKLGIDYATLNAINDKLVYASISGYGDEGPMRDRPGQDLLVQSYSGLTFNGGQASGLPHPSPLYMVDTSASHMACEGILAALVARSRTGKGQEVKTSLLSAIMEMQIQEVTSYLAADAPPRRGASPQVSIWMEPPYGVYSCETGNLAIAQADLEVLSDVLELPQLARLKVERPPQKDADAVTAWRDRICALVAGILATKPAEYWDELLHEHGVWCGVVQDYATFLENGQADPYLVSMEHAVGGTYKTVAPGIRFSDDPQPEMRGAPIYGADSTAILSESGFGEAEIGTLLQSGAVVENSDQ